MTPSRSADSRRYWNRFGARCVSVSVATLNGSRVISNIEPRIVSEGRTMSLNPSGWMLD